MNTGRIILLAIALLAGGGAFFLVSMSGGQQTPEVITQVMPQAERDNSVRVLVADGNFSKGQPIDPAVTKWVKFPKDNLPEYFIQEDNDDFFNSLDKAIARTDIYQGEPITEAKIVKPGDRSMMAALLTPGMRAVSINIDPQTSTGGFVLPGDRVDIYFTKDVADGQDTKTVSELLYSNLRVLAIDQTIAGSTEGSVLGRTATVEIAPWQVEEFLEVRESADNVNLVLRSAFAPENGEEIEQEVRPTEVRIIRYGRS